MYHLAFGPKPIIQGATLATAPGEPELSRALLNLGLCPKVFSHGQDNGRGKVRVNQLDVLCVAARVTRLGADVESRLVARFPTCLLREAGEQRIHGRTSMTELREP